MHLGRAGAGNYPLYSYLFLSLCFFNCPTRLIYLSSISTSKEQRSIAWRYAKPLHNQSKPSKRLFHGCYSISFSQFLASHSSSLITWIYCMKTSCLKYELKRFGTNSQYKRATQFHKQKS